MKRSLGAALPAFALAPLLLVAPLFWHALGLWQTARSEPPCAADIIVVMGAAQYDGQPSPVFENRLRGALELYRAGCAPRLLVTGGKREGDRFSEGEAGARFLREAGVPASALLAETKSRNSVENLRFSLEVTAGRRVIIVTDDMHAYRSRYIASRLGPTAYAAPVPSRGPRLGYALRELLTVTAYSFGVTVRP